MSRSAAAIVILIIASAARAQSQPTPTAANASGVPWAVSVVHTIDLQRMVDLMRDQQKLRVGVSGTAPRYIYNITTGIAVDQQGHVVTRLNLDPQEKEHKLSVTTSDGTTLAAKLIGVDFATGFAVLEVGLLKAALPTIAGPSSLVNGAAVKILSSDVVPKVLTDKIYLSPSITVSQGHIRVDSLYSKARGALTLLSGNLLARSDSSVVVTSENELIGIAQYAGFGRAYLYPIQFIRDTVVKRVIEKKDNVPAGWLGIRVDNVAQLSDSDFGASGLQRRAGVIVRQITPESAAAQAGLKLSDIITRVDDSEIAGTADLKASLSSLPAGQSVKLQAIRDHRPLELTAVLGSRPYNEQGNLAIPFDQTFEPALSVRAQLEKRLQELADIFRGYKNIPPSRETNEAVRELALEIRQIQDSLRALDNADPTPLAAQPPRPDYGDVTLTGERLTADFDFPAGFTARDVTSQLATILQARGGVLVASVAKGSPADRAGLKAGDVIVGAQERVLMGTAQLQVLLSSQHGTIILKVVRHKEPIIVNLNLQ